MSDLVFNRSKGRVTEYAERIEANDPTNSVFTVIPWNSTATDAVIRDLDDVAAIEADANTAERTTGNWNRKTIANGGVTITYDDTNDRSEVDIADQTWTAVTAGNDVTDVSVNYDSDSTSGADSAVRPCTWHDFVITTDGSDVTAQINVFFRAS